MKEKTMKTNSNLKENHTNLNCTVPPEKRRYPKSPFPAICFDRSHILPSPILSDADFNFIPGTYIKNHREIPTEQKLALMTEERNWNDDDE